MQNNLSETVIWIDSNTYVKSPDPNQRGNGKVLTIKQQNTSWITQWSDPVNVDKTLKISNVAADARTIGQKLGVEGASSKNKIAKERNIPIVSEIDFIHQYLEN